MTLVDFADQVSVVRRDDGKLRRCWSHRQVLTTDDLAMRAAALFQAASGSPYGADIAVDKTIPVGSGLGGGSSNAAAVLLLLNQLWAVHWRRRRLMNIARQLGSDVSFFIVGRAARVSGVGERLRAVQLPPQHYLLLFPKVVACTAAVYAEYARRAVKPESLFDNTNHLAAAALSLYPPIAVGARQLRRAAGQACLSGSGACVYAAFGDAAAARQAQKKLPATCRSAVVASLPKHPFYDGA